MEGESRREFDAGSLSEYSLSSYTPSYASQHGSTTAADEATPLLAQSLLVSLPSSHELLTVTGPGARGEALRDEDLEGWQGR